MVEQAYSLDSIFGSLSDPTRRDILRRIRRGSMSVGAIAKCYDFSFAGVAKHLEVLQRAGLVRKTRQGKEQLVSIDPEGLAAANSYIQDYKQLWEQRLDSLESYLQLVNKEGDT